LRSSSGPEVLQRHDELQPELPFVGLERPSQRGAEVVQFGDDEIVTLGPQRLSREVRRPGNVEIVLGVAAPERTVLCLGSQPFRGELSDRLQHPVAPLTLLFPMAKQALVEERLERVDVDLAHRLGGLVVAAASEDREPAEEPLLLRIEQVVRPLDRRAQRLLARVGVAGSLE
jgi:hypothetical protein